MSLTPPLFRVLLAAELRAHAGRAAMGVIAIAIGVAMGYAVFLINHAALAEFSQAVRTLAGQADLEVRGPRSGFDEQWYPRLAGLPEVAVASPVVEAEIPLPGRSETLGLLGVDVFRARAINPGLVGRSSDPSARLDTLDPDVVFLSPAALSWLGLEPGGRIETHAGSDTVSLRVAGTLSVAGVRLAVMDIGAAQWRFGQLGRLQRIDLKLRPGVDPEAFRQKLGALLPPGVTARTPEDAQSVASNLSRAYRVNLDVLALVALFTGAFLVFSGQALSVVSRRAQLALLRALGMTRRGLRRLVLAETLALGVAGSLAGIALGAALAAAALRYGGGDLGAGYFSGLRPALRFSAPAALAFAALGTAAAVLGGLAPAWEASRARPARALKAGDENALAHPSPPWPALALMIGGAALAQAGPLGGLPIFAYLAIGVLLTGAILWMPWVARRVFGTMPRPRRIVPHLALAQLAAAPGRAAIGLAGVVASFSLMAAMAIMVHSFRLSFDQWLDTVVPAQLYVRASAGDAAGYFSDRERRLIEASPGVARTEFMQTDRLVLDPRLPPVALILRPVDARHPQSRLAIVGAAIEPPPGGPPAAWVSEAMVDLYGMAVGQRIELPLEGSRYAFTVAGVWRDYARQYGAIVVDAEHAYRMMGERRPDEAALWLVPGVAVAQVAREIRERLPGADRIGIRTPGEIRRASLRIFDRSFAVTYLLEVVAIVVGLFGVGVSFGAQALARSREFGMLRHIGVTRGQIGAMLALEGALLGALGGAVGLALGGGIAWILVDIVNPQSFHWTMAMHMPWGLLATALAALIAAASLTALACGRRAMSAGAVRAVREDW
ncbi:FtsX-like permease family protein [Castellaniella sp. GW247-6E4]|uniref:ABC transporter permease n=1 Tax=Castellaniella sp. GW247-6E4 TaxID=3140380 RepID=UPI003315FF88